MRCAGPRWAGRNGDGDADAVGPPWAGMRRWSGHDGGPPPGMLRWFMRPARGRIPWRSTLLVTLFMAGGTNGASQGPHDRVDPNIYTVLLVLGAGALLLLRQRYPRVAVYGTVAVCLAYLVAGFPYGPIFISAAVAAFSAISLGARHTAWAGLGLLIAAHGMIVFWLYRWLPPDTDSAGSWGQLLFVTAWAVAIAAGGELMRTRREQWAAAEAERRVARQRRADEERLRIARELHDVLAHSISVINIQAGVGLALLDQQPEKAREALTTIKSASKEALGEVRQVLDALRTPGGAPRSPAPGLDRLDELKEQAAAAGLTVEVTTEGRRTSLPPGTELAAFRIVQEALTNVVRHSGSRTARVRVRYAREGLELQIDDDGPAAASGITGGGNGLVGMRERAAALGGTVEAGTRADGGFRVLARIPLGGTATVSESAAPQQDLPQTDTPQKET